MPSFRPANADPNSDSSNFAMPPLKRTPGFAKAKVVQARRQRGTVIPAPIGLPPDGNDADTIPLSK